MRETRRDAIQHQKLLMDLAANKNKKESQHSLASPVVVSSMQLHTIDNKSPKHAEIKLQGQQK